MTKYTISRIVEETLDLHLPAFTGQRDAQGCDTCSLCKKPSGLVILPVRYAAISSSHAHPDALVTAIGGPFGAGVVEQELSVSKYILRHARVGYLYLHYPAGNAGGRRWERFRITEHACFIQEPLEAPYISQDAELKSCRKSQDWQLSHCITIPEPERIAEVYLAFTEQPWGRRLRKSLEADPGRRMQSLSPQACLAPTVAQPHTTPIDEVDHWVSEYRQGATECFDHQVADLDDAANVKHFQSLFPFHSRAREANSLKETVARGAYPGVIFALWDARGITCELNHEQLQAVEASRQRYGWRLHAWEGIQAIKAAVGDRAEHHHRAKVAGEEDQIPEQIRMLEQQRLAQPPKRVAPREQSMPSQSDIRLASAAHRDRVEVKVAQAQRDFRARALSEEVIEARRAEAWRRTRNNNTPFGEDQALLRLSDEALSAQFEAEVASRLRDDAERIHIPIAEEHAAWLASSALRTYFETDYLRDDLDSGIRYTEHFTECFANGADRAECERVLQGWLEQAEPMNTANLLQRGLFLNQDSLIESTDQLDERLFNWQHGLSVLQRLYTAWNSSRSYLLEQQAAREAGRNALAELIYHAGAPMAKKLSQLVDSSVMRLVKLSAMLSTGRLIVERKLRGTPEQLLEFLLAKMREVLPRGQRPDPQLMARISHSLLVTRLEGGDLHITTLQITQFVLLDEETLRAAQRADQHVPPRPPQRAPQRGTRRSTRRDTGPTALQARQLGSTEPIQLTPQAISEQALPGFRTTHGAGGGAIFVTIGLLFSTIETLIAGETMRKADVFASPQATGRFFASLAGLTAAIMEVTEKAIKGLEDAKRIRAMPGVRRVLTIGGTVLGTGAAWAFALLDGLKAYEHSRRGNAGMASLYTASAGINIALGIAVFRVGLLALSGFVGVLILLALAVALLISWFEESDVQRWLSHCHYGIDPRYPAMAESEKALRRALGGD